MASSPGSSSSRIADLSIKIRSASYLSIPLTSCRASEGVSNPFAKSVSRKHWYTAPPSETVVPAMSKTTSSIGNPTCISIFPQILFDDLLRHPERQRHPRPTDSSDDGYAHYGSRDEIRLGRVFDINAIPSRGDPRLRRVEKCVEVAKYQFVNLLLVERRDLGAVFVRIAEREFAEPVLRDHHMYAVADVIGHFIGKAFFQGGQRRATLKSAVMRQRQPGGEHRPDAPVIRHGMRSHHLQLAANDAAIAKNRWKERLQIVSRAYVQIIRDVLLSASERAAVIVSGHRAVEGELNPVFFAQPGG